MKNQKAYQPRKQLAKTLKTPQASSHDTTSEMRSVKFANFSNFNRLGKDKPKDDVRSTQEFNKSEIEKLYPQSPIEYDFNKRKSNEQSNSYSTLFLHQQQSTKQTRARRFSKKREAKQDTQNLLAQMVSNPNVYPSSAHSTEREKITSSKG